MHKNRKTCDWSESGGELMQTYHDREWGVPAWDDRIQFEFLTLESAQAGLSWLTVLKKRAAYRKAFADFDPCKVARFTPQRIAKLLANPGIIRNKLKVNAAVSNAVNFSSCKTSTAVSANTSGSSLAASQFGTAGIDWPIFPPPHLSRMP